MLYLFGQLALSDALYYHENFLDDDYQPALAGRPRPANAREAAVGRRLRRSRHLPQASRVAAGRRYSAS